MTENGEQPGSNGLDLWVVYERPADVDMAYVARLWNGLTPTTTTFAAQSLDIVRRWLHSQGLYRLDRHPSDDPSIVEIWL